MPPKISLDEALESIPLGLFQYRLLFLCGFAFMTDSLEVNLLTFLATCAGDEWQLSKEEEAAISGVIIIIIIIIMNDNNNNNTNNNNNKDSLRRHIGG